MFFHTIKYQLINVEEMMELEKIPSGKQQAINCYRQESSLDAKISGQKYEKQHIHIVSKNLPTQLLLIKNRKIVTSQYLTDSILAS